MIGFSRLTDYEKRILDNVKRTGSHITVVFDPDSDEPDFAYSAGFATSVKQPDVIVFGLPPEIMTHMVNEILDQCRRGLQLSDGLVIEGLLANHVCVTREVHSEWIDREFFNSAIWYSQRASRKPMPFGAVQIVWPGSEDGLFPWDEGCSDIVRVCQPALYERGLHS